jgi:hypothetical protein
VPQPFSPASAPVRARRVSCRKQPAKQR